MSQSNKTTKWDRAIKRTDMRKNICKWMICSALGLAAWTRTTAQSDGKDSLLAEFTRYQDQAIQEKLYVHMDKSFYVAGEVIWFKVYDVDASTGKPLGLSDIVYVEILDKDQRPVFQTAIGLNDASGNGFFSIPASLASGNYILRAYTSWMKNFSPDLFFHQPVTIVNTLNGSFAAGPRHPLYDIQFFPEGGHLVNGLSARIVWKIVDQQGRGVDASGIIIGQKKDTVASFHTGRFGMGRFSFTPHKDEQYQALISIGDSILTRKLPPIDEQGYTMNLEDAGDQGLKMIVHSNLPGGQNTSSGSPNAASDNTSTSVSTSTSSGNPAVYLFIQTHHIVKGVQLAFLSSGSAIFNIDKATLGDGISQITLFNADRSPVCERLYFKQPAKKMQLDLKTAPASPSATLTREIGSYTTRQKVDLGLSATDPSGHPLEANLSLSVFLLDSLQAIPQENILSYLLLSSDLKGNIESPQYYFENKGPEVDETMDNLMCTQGWSRFRWDDVVHSRRPYFEFLPEIQGPVISAKVTNRTTGRPMPSVMGYLSVPGRRFHFSCAMSRANGDISFNTDDLYGNSEMILQTNNLTDSNCRIDIQSPYSDKFASYTAGGSVPGNGAADLSAGNGAANVPARNASGTLSSGGSSLTEERKNELLMRGINAQVENTYRIRDKHRLLTDPHDDSIAFYGKPDLRYYLADYTRFVTLEEVMREYVADIRLRKQSGKFQYRVRNAAMNQFFEEDPLLLIDGVPVFDADKLMALDPARMERIDVLTRKYYIGPSVNVGIISYRTPEGDLGGYPLDPDAVVLEYKGLEQEREFYTPVYDSPAQTASHIPDTRNQLQWSPKLLTDATGKKTLSFYTSDLTGRYALVVQGLSTSGLPGYTVTSFTVGK